MERLKVAQDIMVTNPVTLAPDICVFDGISRLLRHNISGAPVIDEHQNYLGVFSEKCCMKVLTVTARLIGEPDEKKRRFPLAKEFMVTQLVTLTRQMDAIKAIGTLLQHTISGAPVIDDDRQFFGVFSEKTSMSLLVAAAYDQVPNALVEAFMNTDSKRVISEDVDLLSVAQMFLDTPYRRLPVVRSGQLLGQISRRDVLRAQHHFARPGRDCETALLDQSWQIDRADGDPESPHGRLPSPEVCTFMDAHARTITPETDLLSIAQIFLHTPYRRLPVLREGKLLGQVSRCDVLRAVYNHMSVSTRPEKSLLYLSSLNDRSDSPIA